MDSFKGKVADVSDPQQVQGQAQAALNRWGGIDILCNNAGVGAGKMPSWHSTPRSMARARRAW